MVSEMTSCIGMISGTSMDAVDCALVSFRSRQPELLATHSHPFPDDLRDRIRRACAEPIELSEMARLDVALGQLFSAAVDALVTLAEPESLAAIGSHGQTLLHQTDKQPRYTLQLGDPNLIAAETGHVVVADFRRADLAAGGEGAPLAPLLHEHFLRDAEVDRAILNLGGIANLTLLPRNGATRGFDTGPASCLMDAWCLQHRGEPFDAGGAWAATGAIQPELLQQLLAHPYFQRSAPRSTHTDEFDLGWLKLNLDNTDFSPADVQATLLELTAVSITRALAIEDFTATELLVCGGGVHNGSLMQRLAGLLPTCSVHSTADHGLDPDWVEAILFAWLAWRRINRIPSDTRPITGARTPVVLGGLWQP